MVMPNTILSPSAKPVAEEFDAFVKAVVATVDAWGAVVSASSATDSGAAENVYQTVVAFRSWVEARKATPGLSAAIISQNRGVAGNFNFVTEWNGTTLPAVNNFLLWFQSAWPQKSALGYPAYVKWAASDGSEGPPGEHRTFSVPVTGANRTDVLARVAAFKAAFAWNPA
jgi:hypothetical protein